MSLTLTPAELREVTRYELRDVLERIASAHELEARLWDTADVAAFLKLNPDYTRAHILTRSDFPAAIELPGKGKEPIRRFRGVDVRDWAETYRPVSRASQRS